MQQQNSVCVYVCMCLYVFISVYMYMCICIYKSICQSCQYVYMSRHGTTPADEPSPPDRGATAPAPPRCRVSSSHRLRSRPFLAAGRRTIFGGRRRPLSASAAANRRRHDSVAASGLLHAGELDLSSLHNRLVILGYKT